MQDEKTAIRNVIEDWAYAVRNRDYERILQNHTPDLIMFDVPPPFVSRGLEAYKKSWDLFFSTSPLPAVFDIREMEIFAGEDTAFVVAQMQCVDREDPLDFRLTVGLRKIKGAWTIVHEHHSVPAT